VDADEFRNLLDRGQYEEFVREIKANPAQAVEVPTLLIKAVNMGSLESVRILVGNGANVNAESALPFLAGKSLLIMAIGYGYIEIARYLLESGADPYAGFLGPDSADFGIYLAEYTEEQTSCVRRRRPAAR
jgi:ankyrin repeat protein